MKFYQEYIHRPEQSTYSGNIQIYGNYKFGYLYLIELNILLIIPQLKYLNRSFQDNYVEIELISNYEDDKEEYMNILSNIVNLETNVLFGSIINNTSNNNSLKLSGVLEINSKYSFGKTKKNVPIYQFIPHDRKYPPFYVPSTICKNRKLSYNVYAYIHFKEWTVDSKYPIGMCQQIIGSIGELEADYQYILYNHGLNYKKHSYILDKDTTNNVIEQIDVSQIRDDYRLHNCLSIDPPGCQDIDDAINIVSYPEHYLIQVHIADVSNFVQENSQLDKLARERISSIYAPHKQINMLPEELSTNICSLLKQQERLVMTVNYKCDKLFKIESVEITKGIINCDFNLEYDIADQLLNQIRNKNTKNYPPWVSHDLILLHQFITKNNILERELSCMNSHDIIDTLMVVTNSHVGEYLYKYPSSLSLLRVHHQTELSQLKKLNNLTSLASESNVSNFLEIYYSQSAEYIVGNQTPESEINHYGLKTKFYTHFTSPIRRYWDILVHRQLKKIINKKKENSIKVEELESYQELCHHINKQHKLIKVCQRHLDNRKILETLLDNQKLETESFITRLSEKYLQIYIPELNMCHDFRPFSNKLDSLLIYQLNSNELIITNRHTKRQTVFKVMDSLQVTLINFKFYPVDKQLSVSITKPNILDLIG